MAKKQEYFTWSVDLDEETLRTLFTDDEIAQMLQYGYLTNATDGA